MQADRYRTLKLALSGDAMPPTLARNRTLFSASAMRRLLKVAMPLTVLAELVLDPENSTWSGGREMLMATGSVTSTALPAVS